MNLIQQGYGAPGVHGVLPHTGQDLTTFVLIGLILIAVGAITYFLSAAP